MKEFNVLLVEDDDFDATLLKSHMSKSNVYKYNITRSINIEEAQEALHTQAFDVILLDLTLPDSTGFETLTTIFLECKEVPILILTSYDSDEFGVKAIELGAQDYLIKGETNPKFLSRCISHCILRKKVEQSIIEERKKALTHSELKTKYLANVTHEIRTPLNIITGLASALSETQLNDEQLVYLKKLSYSCDSLLYLVNDVLDLSKIEEGKLDIEIINFDIYELLNHLIEMIGTSATSKGLKLKLEIDPNVPRKVDLDPNRLTQVLINLLGNSVKFTSEGEIKLILKSLGNDDKKHKLHFCIEDTGIGISAPGLKKIFSEYQQAQTSIARKFGGTGLGLALSQKIVTILGGKIKVESEEGVGSKFFFDLDVSYDKSSMNTLKESILPNVIMLKSEEANYELLISTMEKLKINIIEVDCVETLQDMLKNEKSDLIVVSYKKIADDLEGFSKVTSINYAPPTIVVSPISLEESQYTELDKYKINYFNLSDVGKVKVNNILTDSLKRAQKTSKERENLRTIVGDHQFNILLADDNVENHDLIRIFFKKIPFTFNFVDNGKLAYEEFQKDTFDLVLMDMQMPVMDGLTSIGHIRDFEQKESRTPTPILAFTANAIKEQLDSIVTAGANGYILKPFKKWQLVEAIINTALEGKDKP